MPYGSLLFGHIVVAFFAVVKISGGFSNISPQVKRHGRQRPRAELQGRTAAGR